MSLDTLAPDRLLRVVATRTPDAAAITDLGEGRQLTYRELDERVEALAGALTEAGHRAGDRLALSSRNSWRLVVGLLAAGRAGLVAVPLDPRLSPNGVADVCERAGARLLVSDEAVAAGRGLDGIPDVDWSTLLDQGPPQPAGAPTAAGPPAGTGTLMATSGSTGNPKLVCLPRGWDGANGLGCLPHLGLQGQDLALQIAPLFHAAAWACAFVPALAAGAHNIVQAFAAEATLSAVDEQQPTFVLAVPTQFELLRRVAVEQGDGLRHRVELAVSTAATPQHATVRWLGESFARRVGFMYGLTETGGALTYREASLEEVPSSRSFIGAPILGTEVQVVPGDGEADRGELIARTSKQMTAYLNNPDATEERVRDGWVYSGDLVERTPSGDLLVLDRTDDLVITGGENVAPSAIEDVLLRHPAIDDCAVTGEPDELWGQRVVAYVVADPVPGLDELHEWLRVDATLARFQWPRELRATDSIPRNPTGKTMRRQLTGAAGRGASPSP